MHSAYDINEQGDGGAGVGSTIDSHRHHLSVWSYMKTSDAPSGVEFDIAGIAVAQGHKDDPTQRRTKLPRSKRDAAAGCP